MAEDADWARPGGAGAHRPRFDQHSLILAPGGTWESVRLGGGTPPVRLDDSWFTIYHGVGSVPRQNNTQERQYSAGALVLDLQDPRKVLYRSPRPTLAPLLAEERAGIVSNVVFPTAVDLHPTYLDVYYGMADACIGVARMDRRSPAYAHTLSVPM